MILITLRALRIIAVAATVCFALSAQQAVRTAQYGNRRTAANLKESTLNVDNVNVATFGKIFSRVVDDSVYAEPLYIPDINIPGKGRHNVIYIATMSNTVYAFDADDPAQLEPLWVRHIGPAFPTGGGFIQTSWGILSTPVIHSGVMYLVAYIGNTLQTWSLYLCALDIRNGSDKFGPPAEILFPLNGSLVKATPATIQRAGLLVANQRLYVGFANFQVRPPDLSSQEGFLYAYDLSDITHPIATFQTSLGQGADIWQAGRGLAADNQGYIYALSGAGFYDGRAAFGDSVLKFNSNLELVDWFTPANWQVLYNEDLDLSANGAMLVPGTEFVIAGGKQGVIYILNRHNLGKLQTGTNNGAIAQIQASNGCGLTDCSQSLSTAIWVSDLNLVLYVWDRHDVPRSYSFEFFDRVLRPVSQGAIAPEAIGGITLSASGATYGTGIVWAITTDGNPNDAIVPGTVRALDARNLSRELWNSDLNPPRDSMGNFTKFSSPLVVNGKVYVVTQSNRIQVYGLLPGK